MRFQESWYSNMGFLDVQDAWHQSGNHSKSYPIPSSVETIIPFHFFFSFLGLYKWSVSLKSNFGGGQNSRKYKRHKIWQTKINYLCTKSRQRPLTTLVQDWQDCLRERSNDTDLKRRRRRRGREGKRGLFFKTFELRIKSWVNFIILVLNFLSSKLSQAN